MHSLPNRLDVLRARWLDCERALFSSVLTDPGQYEAAIEAVRVVASHLAEADCAGVLDGDWQLAEELAVAAFKRLGDVSIGLSARLVAGASFAIRDRELRATVERRRRLSEVRAGAAAGRSWVQIEAAPVAPLAGMSRQWEEIHIRSGKALVCSLEPDLSTGSAVLVICEVAMNLDSGGLVAAQDPQEDLRASDPSTIESVLALARRRIELAASRNAA